MNFFLKKLSIEKVQKKLKSNELTRQTMIRVMRPNYSRINQTIINDEV